MRGVLGGIFAGVLGACAAEPSPRPEDYAVSTCHAASVTTATTAGLRGRRVELVASAPPGDIFEPLASDCFIAASRETHRGDRFTVTAAYFTSSVAVAARDPGPTYWVELGEAGQPASVLVACVGEQFADASQFSGAASMKLCE